MGTQPKLEMILERIKPGKSADCFALWACRGAGRGCQRNSYREKKKHCEDCVPAHDLDETLGELMDRMKRGDA